MLRINPELGRKIEEILSTQPKADEDSIVDIIANSNSIRMKKEAIKAGVKEYLRKAAPKPEEKKQPLTVDLELEKPKKRVKREKGELQIEFEDKPYYKFEKLGGIADVLKEIEQNIFLPIQHKQALASLGIRPNKGFLLAGPVGSGKTYLTNCILSDLKNRLQFNAYSLNSLMLTTNDAEDNMKKLFQAAKENQPSVVFIDDIDYMCNKEASKRPQGSPMFSLVSEIERVKDDNVYLIATTSNPEKVDVSLRKINRFEKTITLNMSGEKTREEILGKLLEGIVHNLTTDEIVDISRCTSGFMAGDLVMLIREAGLQSLIENTNSPTLTAETLKKCTKWVQPMLKKEGFTDIPSTTLDDVGGLQSLKAELRKEIILPMTQQHKFKQMKFDIQSGGVLLYGPPGCGKTMLAKAIANAVRANFIIVKGPELLNKYVGESEQAVREVFGRAQRASPCVIFFDEFDALAPKRSDQGNQVTERVVNTLLTALDGVEERKMVFVIAATNRKDMIDQAMLRAGRIQKHLYVPQPNEEERVDILKAITKSMRISKDINFMQVAKKSKGFSGADLKYLIKQATVSAVMSGKSEVTQTDIDQALGNLLEQKNRPEKSHEIELKDNEENEQYVFHSSIDKSKVEMAVEKENVKSKQNISGVFEEFLEYLVNKKSKNRSAM